MLAVSLLRWWYSQGWLEATQRLKAKIRRIYQSFSVPLLLRTLFKPWRQIVASKDPNATIGVKLRQMVDNLVSRFIGFWVRVFTLLAGTIVLGGLLILGLVWLAVWPLLPLSVIWLIAKGAGL